MSQYRMVNQGQASRDSNWNNYIIKPGLGKIRRPSWCKDNETNETVVRVLPSMDSDGSWVPYRYSTANRDTGDWIRKYDAVRSFGTGGYTWLLYDPMAKPGYNLDNNPAVILYKAVDRAIKAGQEEQGWARMMDGGAGRGPALSKNTEVYILRVAIFKINNKMIVEGDKGPLGLNDSDLPYFLELPQSAGDAFFRATEARNENFNPEVSQDSPDFWDLYYQAGDIVSLDRGAFIRFFRSGCDPQAAQAGPAQGNAARPITVGQRGVYAAPARQKAENRFDCAVEKTWMGWLPAFVDEQGVTENLIRNKWRPWEEVLNFPTDAQQAAWINENFPASMVMYAFSDHQEWISEATRSRAVNRTSATVTDGATAPAPAAVVPGLRRATSTVAAPAANAPATRSAPATTPANPTGAQVVNWGARSAGTDPDEAAAAAAAAPQTEVDTASGQFDQPAVDSAPRGTAPATGSYRDLLAARARAQAQAQAKPSAAVTSPGV